MLTEIALGPEKQHATSKQIRSNRLGSNLQVCTSALPYFHRLCVSQYTQDYRVSVEYRASGNSWELLGSGYCGGHRSCWSCGGYESNWLTYGLFILQVLPAEDEYLWLPTLGITITNDGGLQALYSLHRTHLPSILSSRFDRVYPPPSQNSYLQSAKFTFNMWRSDHGQIIKVWNGPLYKTCATFQHDIPKLFV